MTASGPGRGTAAVPCCWWKRTRCWGHRAALPRGRGRRAGCRRRRRRCRGPGGRCRRRLNVVRTPSVGAAVRACRLHENYCGFPAARGARSPALSSCTRLLASERQGRKDRSRVPSCCECCPPTVRLRRSLRPQQHAFPLRAVPWQAGTTTAERGRSTGRHRHNGRRGRWSGRDRRSGPSRQAQRLGRGMVRKGPAQRPEQTGTTAGAGDGPEGAGAGPEQTGTATGVGRRLRDLDACTALGACAASTPPRHLGPRPYSASATLSAQPARPAA
jgi:hypothetical protein